VIFLSSPRFPKLHALYNPASSLQPRVLSTTPRPLYNPASSLQPRVLHHPPRYKATLPSHTCSECLCFGYVYPASTLSVCIPLTWGLKRQITHLMLDQAKLSTIPVPSTTPRPLHRAGAIEGGLYMLPLAVIRLLKTYG
jgi:hypothetical protein